MVLESTMLWYDIYVVLLSLVFIRVTECVLIHILRILATLQSETDNNS